MKLHNLSSGEPKLPRSEAMLSHVRPWRHRKCVKASSMGHLLAWRQQFVLGTSAVCVDRKSEGCRDVVWRENEDEFQEKWAKAETSFTTSCSFPPLRIWKRELETNKLGNQQLDCFPIPFPQKHRLDLCRYTRSLSSKFSSFFFFFFLSDRINLALTE